MRRLILKFHLVIALVAGAFMVLLGMTGSIIAFEPDLDRLLHPKVSHVMPGGRVLSLVEIGDAISRKYPGEAVIAYLPSTMPDFPTQVILSRGIVSVNQYSGDVLGVRTRGQTFLGIVRALHVRLAAGTIGKNIVRWSAVAMLFSGFSGLYLWWPFKRIRIRGSLWSRAFWFDLHNAIGIFCFVPLLVLAASGTVIGFEDQASSLLDKMTRTSQIHTIQLPPSHDQQGLVQLAPGKLTPDQAVAIACSRLPRAKPYRVQMPQYGGRYVVHLVDTDNRITGGRNSVAIDPQNGDILSENLSSDLAPTERLVAWNGAIHEGNALGSPGRIITVLASILLPMQVLSGLIMWFRRPKIADTRHLRVPDQ